MFKQPHFRAIYIRCENNIYGDTFGKALKWLIFMVTKVKLCQDAINNIFTDNNIDNKV